MVTLKQNENSPNQNNIKTNNVHTLDTTVANVDFEIDEAIKATPMLVNTNAPTQTKGLNEPGSKDLPIVIGSQTTPARNKDVIIDLEPSDEAILTQDHNTQIRKAQKEYFKVTSNKETYIEFHEENYKRTHLENDTKPETKLSAIKSYVKCEITGIIDKVNTFTERFDEKMRWFDNMAKTIDIFQQNISFLQNQLISKDELIKSLMDTQTTILETFSKKKQKNVSEEKPVNEHDDSDDDEHNNEFQHQQEQIKDQNMQNVDNTPKRLYIGNLNPDVTEDELNNLLRLKSTKYLCRTCSIEMPMDKNTGKSKSFAFLTIPSHISDEVKKLNGIKFQNRQIKIQDAKTRAVPVSPNKNKHQRPQLVTNKIPEKQHSFSTKSKYAPEKKPTSPSHKKSSKENIIVFGDSIPNFSKSSKNEINRKLVSRGTAKFKYFPGATSKDLLQYIDSTLEDQIFNVAIIHVGTNDILNNGQDAINYLLENIQKMVKKCESYGIEKVLISGLIFTTRY